MTVSVLLIAPLDEPLSRDARGLTTIHAHDLVTALTGSARLHAGLALTVVAARGSEIDAPLIGIDPTELGDTSPGVHALLFQALAMAGGFDGYDLVHCLAAAPGAIQFHAARGGGTFYSPSSGFDPALLAALARLKGFETADLSVPASIAQALHPIDSVRIGFDERPRTKLCRTSRSEEPDSRHFWTVIDSPADLAAGDAAVVVGPSGGSRFEHLCWATRSLASGAVYVHDRMDLKGIDWPQGGVRQPGSAIDMIVSQALKDAGGPERFRRWALAYCAFAATAAGLRRRYLRMRAARA